MVSYKEFHSSYEQYYSHESYAFESDIRFSHIFSTSGEERKSRTLTDAWKTGGGAVWFITQTHKVHSSLNISTHRMCNAKKF